MTLDEALEKTQVPEPFRRVLRFVLEHETAFTPGHGGDYDHVRTERDPADPGGTTRYGVDEASHPHVDVAELDFAGAVEIYQTEYLADHCDRMPWPVNLTMFDDATNTGAGHGIKRLQAALGLVPDGVYGPNTDYTVKTAAHDPVKVAREMLRLREHYYEGLPERLRSRYLRGWLARCHQLFQTIES